MADLETMLEAELDRLTAPIVRADISELPLAERRRALPLERRQEIAREAGPTGSREYRSAMRRLQRYVTGAGEIRRPSAETLRRLGRIAGAARLSRGPVRAVIVGLVRVSKDLRRRTVAATLPAAAMRRIVTPYLGGDMELAADRFLDAFIRAYSGVPVGFESVERLRLEPGAAEAAA